MPGKFKTFWVGSLPSLFVPLESRARQLHLLYAWKNDLPHYDYITIFLILLIYIAFISYMPAAWRWPSLQHNCKLPILRKNQQLIQQMGASCEIHQPMKYYRVRTHFKDSWIPLSRAHSWIRQLCSGCFLQEPCTLAGYQHVQCYKIPAGRAQKNLFLCSGTELNVVRCF